MASSPRNNVIYIHGADTLNYVIFTQGRRARRIGDDFIVSADGEKARVSEKKR